MRIGLSLSSMCLAQQVPGLVRDSLRHHEATSFSVDIVFGIVGAHGIVGTHADLLAREGSPRRFRVEAAID